MNVLIEVLTRTVLETAYFTGIIILVGLFLGILRNNSIRNFQRSFGSKAVMVTGVIGVPIHELSHAFLALIFGHRINEIKLLQEPDANGVLGYVNHSYNTRSIYQQIGNFFIGIAPIFGGIASIIILMKFTINGAYNDFINIVVRNFHITNLNKEIIEGIINSYFGLVKSIFSVGNFGNPRFYIFLLIAICISSHISLSTADIKGASRGLGIIFIILFLLNMFGLFKYISAIDIIRYNVLITSFLFIAVVLSMITFLVSLIAVTISSKKY